MGYTKTKDIYSEECMDVCGVLRKFSVGEGNDCTINYTKLRTLHKTRFADESSCGSHILSGVQYSSLLTCCIDNSPSTFLDSGAWNPKHNTRFAECRL